MAVVYCNDLWYSVRLFQDWQLKYHLFRSVPIQDGGWPFWNIFKRPYLCNQSTYSVIHIMFGGLNGSVCGCQLVDVVQCRT